MNFNPLHDNLIIQPKSSSDTQTASGLYIPETSAINGAITSGTVVAVGPGHIYDSGNRGEMLCKVGDTVWYAKGHASTITLESRDYKVVAERNIFGFTR